MINPADARPGDIVIPGWAAHPDISPLISGPGDEEFDGPLGPGWTQLGALVTAYDVNKTRPSCFWYKVPSGVGSGTTGVLAGFYKPLPVKPPFRVWTCIPGALTTPAPSGTANFLGASLALGDAGGAGRWVTIERGEQTLTGQDFEFNHWTDPTHYVNATAGDFEPNVPGWAFMTKCYLMMEVDATNGIRAYGSTDGIEYRLVNTSAPPYAPGFTPALVGLLVEIPSYGTLIEYRANYDFLRFQQL